MGGGFWVGINEAVLEGSGLKSTRQCSVKGHRMCSTACVVDYDINHMAACH